MGKRILWLENCYPISTRSRRIIDSLQRCGCVEVAICAWDRRSDPQGVGSASAPPGEYVLRTPIGYTNLYRKILGLPSYVRYAKHAIEHSNPDAIAASFWDMALVAAFVAPFGVAILYDVIDMPAGSGLTRWAGRVAELVALRRVRAVLLASRFFAPFYRRIGLASLVLENLPSLATPPDEARRQVANPVRIAYVGNVRYPGTLAPLMRVCTQRNLQLDIWGDGSALPALQKQFERFGMIRFHGRYEYRDLPRILQSVDLLWAAYPVGDFNVRFAISNKFFESINFVLPAVFSSNTALGDYVEREGIGFSIDASSDLEVGVLVDGLLANRQPIADVRAALQAFKARSAGKLTWPDLEPDLISFFQRQGMVDAPR